MLFYVVVIAAVIQYFFCPRYTFTEGKPFTGEFYYNPYAGSDSIGWQKANFHVHSRRWMGLTSGRDNANETIDSIYRYLDYDIVNISDYQLITDFGKDRKGYIPMYEHGYLFPKTHHLVFNVRNVCWLDFLFPQTKHNKQFLLNKLQDNDSVTIAIAHPARMNAFSPDDFKYLGNYPLIEAMNHHKYSFAHWDAALSSGYPAFLVADDESHEVKNPHEVDRVCSYVRSSLDKDSILDALRAGRSYGAEIHMEGFDDFAAKRNNSRKLPKLQSVEMSGDTFKLKISAKAELIRLVGQNGSQLQAVYDSNATSYVFRPTDSYIRAVIMFYDHSYFFLNPVFRYDGKNLPVRIPQYNALSTWMWRGMGTMIIALLFYLRRRNIKRHVQGS